MAHLTVEQRYTIQSMLEQGFKQKDIAQTIGKDKSVVSREIRRNRDQRNGKYRYDLAQRKYESRQREKPKAIKFTDEVRDFINLKLKELWSPEQIANCHQAKSMNMVSHERIYQYIIEDKKHGGDLYKYLRRQKKYRKRIGSKDRRGKIKDQKSIKERPKIVDEKTRVGDFEVDLVIGANHKGALLTINDRRSGLAIIRLIKSKKSKLVAKEIVKALKPYKKYLHTITSDNGMEFADHKYVSKKLGIEFYFAEPYSSWQRGANENLNGLIRQYFPKKSDFLKLTWRDIKYAEEQLNKRPRKRLGYNSPIDEFDYLTKVAFAA